MKTCTASQCGVLFNKMLHFLAICVGSVLRGPVAFVDDEKLICLVKETTNSRRTKTYHFTEQFELNCIKKSYINFSTAKYFATRGKLNWDFKLKALTIVNYVFNYLLLFCVFCSDRSPVTAVNAVHWVVGLLLHWCVSKPSLLFKWTDTLPLCPWTHKQVFKNVCSRAKEIHTNGILACMF